MRRSPLTVLRSLALLPPLAAAALSGCQRTAIDPDPRPRFLPNSDSCPPTAPTAATPCNPAITAPCNYREVATTCRCGEGSQWECATIQPTRGPLPPPELGA